MHHMFTYKENVFKELFLDKLSLSKLFPFFLLFTPIIFAKLLINEKSLYTQNSGKENAVQINSFSLAGRWNFILICSNINRCCFGRSGYSIHSKIG